MLPGLLLALGAAPAPPPDSVPRDPVAYTIDASLDERAHVLRATERIAYRNATGPELTRLYLYLFPNAFRNARTAYAREHVRLPSFANPLDWIPWGSRRGFITIRSLRVGGQAAAFTVHETVMVVPLASPLKPGDSLSVEIAFEVKLPVLQLALGFRGSNYAIALWYPKLAVADTAGWPGEPAPTEEELYANCGTYDVRLTAARGIVVAASGERVDSTDNGDGTTTQRWRAGHARYFAWVADRHYRVKRITWNGVAVDYLYVGREDRALARAVETIRAVLDFYGSRYGPYPHRTLVIAETPALGSGIGGVAYSQLIMVPAGLRHPVFGALPYDAVLAHEIAHQWWGMTVGVRATRDDWLNEGFAEFAAWDFDRTREAQGGAGAGHDRGDKSLRRFEYLNQANFGVDRTILQPDSAFDDAGVHEVALYAKAPFVLEMLQYLVGRDTLDTILRTYAARFRYRTVRTADFIAVADSISGRNLTWFFDEWLAGTATCDYAIAALSATPQPGGRYRSVITVRRNGRIIMPVEVEVTLADGAVLRRAWAGQDRSHQIVIDSAPRVRRAVLDPDARLLETERFNNYYPRIVRASFWPRFKADEAYHIVHLPFVFYDDGVELGALLAGGRTPWTIPPAWEQPPHFAVALAGYNFGTGSPTVALAYSGALGFLGRRSFWGVSGRRDRQREEATLSARALLGPHFYRGPFHTVTASLGLERRFAASPQADSGTVVSIELGYSLRALATDFYPVHGGAVAFAAEGGWKGLGSDWAFLRLAGRAAIYHRVLGGTKLALNLFAGSVAAGSAPRQRMLLLSREGNFRAAQFDTVAGAHLTAVNGEVRVPVGTGTLLGVAAFVNLAKYWGSGPEAARGLQREVGVGLRLFDNASFGVQLDVPFWTSTGAGTQMLDFARVSLRVGRPFHGPGA
jgi:Peptidase family M1 domain